jgi:hypothetical protein
MILPGYSGTPYFAGDRAGVRFGWNFFLGTEGRVVARNIFVDGNTFQRSGGIAKKIDCDYADHEPIYWTVSSGTI